MTILLQCCEGRAARNARHRLTIRSAPLVQLRKEIGGPDTIRTCDLCLRRATLYPAELRVPTGCLARPNRMRKPPLSEAPDHGFTSYRRLPGVPGMARRRHNRIPRHIAPHAYNLDPDTRRAVTFRHLDSSRQRPGKRRRKLATGARSTQWGGPSHVRAPRHAPRMQCRATAARCGEMFRSISSGRLQP